MKILVTTDKPFAAVAVNGIKDVVESAGIELALLEKYGEKSKLLDAVKDVEGLIVRSDIIDAEVLNAAKQLKVVVRAGAGYDNIDLATATANGVCVMNTPGQNSNAVAELVFGMTVMMARNLYNGTSGTELKGKKLGIHAFGQVGRNVARIAKGFGMEVFAFDPYCPASVMEAEGVKPITDINELYSTCQYVSLHIPATNETKKSINYALLKQMPKGAMLINTARKEVINEEELVQIIKSLLEKYIIKTIVMGNGTSSKKKYDLLKREFIDRDIVLINEYRTTDEARKLYFQENPPKGWKKLIPLGMQVPPVPVDDYAAIVIGRKYLKHNK
mgnify:CR=1 FL=1